MAKVKISETACGKLAAQFEGYSYRIERHQKESTHGNVGNMVVLVSLYRNLQNLGFQQEYVDDEAVRKYFRMISGIPFLPTHLAQSTYDEVVDSTPLRIRHKMQPFYHYFTNTWLNGQYAIQVWNVYGQDRRTNNDIESWHSKL
ncbi:unnamed protein product [Didymodactylos carnosus]|uniref:Uncharacterized protein n=1 Tax=Didymodactylos carnosus TaxID=1234261 RepID=A0A814XGP8_9BILA|nr:unnamed protein product [Didymodactylos carnosus]CAF3977827.1 unnamed protein product [Didymodactylos carnosus]